MLRRIIKRTVVVLAAVAFAGCGKTAVSTAGYRVVSLSPAVTEIIFALNAGDMLVGVTTYCDYPPAARQKYKVGDFSNPSLERIIATNPSLVVVNLPEQRRVKETLEAFKIPVYVSSPRSIADIYREIAEIGTLLGRQEYADTLIGKMQRALEPRPATGKKVYVELSAKPLVTIGKRTFLDEIIRRAGAENIFSELDKDYPVVPQEEVIRRNPDIIIVLHPGNVLDRVGWKEIEAVRRGEIYRDLNQDLLMRPGPRLVDGFKDLERIVD